MKVPEYFDAIKTAWTKYRGECKTALSDYRTQVERGKQTASRYKDDYANEVIEDAKKNAAASARTALTAADEEFTAAVSLAIGGLRSELNERLCAPAPAAVMDTLRAYRDFGIVPSTAEAECLASACNGNFVALRALKSVASDCDVTFPDLSTYVTDLDKMEKHLCQRMQYAPDGYDGEYCEVYPTWMTARADGTMYETGTKSSALQTILRRSFLEDTFDDLSAVSDKWSAAIVTTVKERVKDGEGMREAVENFKADVADMASASEHETTAAERAERLAAERAGNEEQARKIIAKYAQRDI